MVYNVYNVLIKTQRDYFYKKKFNENYKLACFTLLSFIHEKQTFLWESAQDKVNVRFMIKIVENLIFIKNISAFLKKS